MSSLLLNKIPFFADLSHDDTLTLMGCMKQVSYSRGEKIFREDDPADHLYLIIEGSVKIFKEGLTYPTILATIPAGGFFGEFGLIDGLPRSASAGANTDCKLMRLSGKDFETVIRVSPSISRNVMKNLVRLLREKNTAKK
jgi:CRP/FNR family transcriptional regulator/CRP/FNR family cyclic AMP-dependent transcriptional regulator